MMTQFLNTPFEIWKLILANGDINTNIIQMSLLLVIIFGIVGYIVRWIIK